MSDVANIRQGEEQVVVAGSDDTLVKAVAASLRYEGLQVADAANGRELLETVAASEPHLVILQCTLPDMPGPDAVRALRERGFQAAVLYLAGSNAVDVAPGDELLAQPFTLAEVAERARLMLLRCAEGPSEPLRFADLVLDEERHEVFRDDHRIDLTPTEFNLLRFFLQHPHRILSKRQILQHVWRHSLPADTNVVETYVSYLRRKLDRFGPPLIRTVRRFGYVLDREA
jgi:two-component system OmpR family response regulator